MAGLLIPLHLHPHNRTGDALLKRAELHFVCAQLNPQGFRTPGRRGTSSAEKAAIAAGMMDGKPGERSSRGKAKAKARARHIEKVKEQQRLGLETRANRQRRKRA